jgi:hypothetical protein
MAAFRDAVAVVGGLKVGGFAAIPRHPGDGWGGVVALPDEALGRDSVDHHNNLTIFAGQGNRVVTPMRFLEPKFLDIDERL